MHLRYAIKHGNPIMVDTQTRARGRQCIPPGESARHATLVTSVKHAKKNQRAWPKGDWHITDEPRGVIVWP